MIEPAHLWIPPRVGSYGSEAVDLAERAGRVLDEEQQFCVDALLSYGPGGRWLTLESAMIEARQNGKTAGVLLPVTLFDLFLMDNPDRIVWTAHLFRTAREAFDDFCTCIETAPELSRRVKNISYGHGEESIELHDGSLLEFLARSNQSGRGLGGKRVVFDEALFLAGSVLGSLMPVLSARPDPQINYGSSAAKATSEHLHRLIKRGRKGGDPSLIWVEYCAPGSWEDPGCEDGRDCGHMPDTPGCVLDDESLLPHANHTVGRRITYAYVRQERRALPPNEFGRERFGWHEMASDAGGTIDAGDWSAMGDVLSKRDGDVALAVDIAPDRSYSAIALYGLREDAYGHLQLMDFRPGTQWIVPRLVELREALEPIAVGIGRASFASLEQELHRAGFSPPEDPDAPLRGELSVASGVDMAAACGQLLDAVRQRSLKHIEQDQLTTSVLGGRTRETGGSVAWSRKDAEVELAPLVASTLARWAFVSRVDIVGQEVEPWVEFV